MMKKKRIPLRKCLISSEQFPKKELTRVVINKEQEVSIDLTSKANGRGAYLKLTRANVELARKRKILEREFELKDLAKIYDELLELADE
jgi:predicted RNA-binding protein YlxR (DUF448 family)